jgi:hypothetical protein
LFAAAAGGVSGTTWVVGALSSQNVNYGLNESGFNGYRFSTTGAIPGDGGSDTLGAGARALTAGANGGKGASCSQGYGGGGAGGNSTAAINTPGGGGCNGAIILTEYGP